MTLAITLSSPYQFANDTGKNVVFTLTSISAYNYLVVFYGDSATPNGPLSATVMKASSDGSVVTSDASAAFTPPYGFSTLSTSISGFFKATTLDSGDFVVAYSDSTTGNGVTCVLIQYDSSLGQILFTSILQLTTGFSLKAYRYIRIATIGNGLQFMVVFPDSALGGAVVAAIGEVRKFHRRVVIDMSNHI